MQEIKPFDQWAIVELMGHQRIAGRVTEQAVGGSNFVRVDVPQIEKLQPFTKLFGPGAIYAITIVDQETATAYAAQLRERPLDEWSARRMIAGMIAHSGDEQHVGEFSGDPEDYHD